MALQSNETMQSGSVRDPDGRLVVTQYAAALAFARINADADGDNTVVAAAGAGNKIRVLSYVLAVSAATTTTPMAVKSGSTTTLAEFTLPAGGGAAYGGPTPAFETAANQALVINNPAGVDTNGHLAYIVVT